MKHLCLFTVATLLFFACKKTASTEGIIISPPPPAPEYINISLQGKVLNENKVPIEGSAVKFGNNMATTDSNGVFRFDSVDIDKHATVVQVSKPGYFSGFRTFDPHKGVLNFAQLQLLPQKISGSFSSAKGGTVAITSGGSIVFPAKAIVLASDSSAFTGNVNVSIQYLDPTRPEMADVIPGDRRGVDRTGEIKGLQSFGIGAVELNSDAGQKLQLAPGKMATLSLPIPSSLNAAAPANISMWYFDESRGFWKEEGTAVKQGSAYVAQVRHFSYWGGHLPSPAYQFKLMLKTAAGVPLIDTKVTLNDPYNIINDLITDNNGFATSWVWMISGQPIKLNVRDKCGNILYTADLPAFSDNVDLGTIVVSSPLLNSIVLSGKAINCNGDSVLNGYARVRIDDYNYSGAIHNGSFSIRFNRCNINPVTAAVSVVDTDSSKWSIPANIIITNSSQPYHAGILVACDTIISREEYFYVTIEGKNYAINHKSDSLTAILGSSGGITIRANYKVSSNVDFYMSKSTYDGWYAIIGSIIYAGRNGAPLPPQTTTYSEYGGVGKYIAGTFSGQMYKDLGYLLIPFSGSFRIKITQK